MTATKKATKVAKKANKKTNVVKVQREVIVTEVNKASMKASTSWNKCTFKLSGKKYKEARAAAKKGSKELSAVMREAGYLSELQADSKARKSGKCKNTQYETVKTLRKRLLAL